MVSATEGADKIFCPIRQDRVRDMRKNNKEVEEAFPIVTDCASSSSTGSGYWCIGGKASPVSVSSYGREYLCFLPLICRKPAPVSAEVKHPTTSRCRQDLMYEVTHEGIEYRRMIWHGLKVVVKEHVVEKGGEEVIRG
ncbi:hypothetical protein PIB30_042518 [Stylosanthes scabra]|uniref:Uncharacterized protein n=1 Tax=Stylosanthes scabra TaxID=79078 RepID=A0ABU6TEW2_9FABA|nr:hypothetical protein [Stylosanthes scabra]